MLLPRRADSVNYFLLGSAAIICIFHLAVIDVAGGRGEGRGGGGRRRSLCVSTTLGWKKKDGFTDRTFSGAFIRAAFQSYP